MSKYKFKNYAEEVEAVGKMSKEEYDEYVRVKVQEASDNLANGGKTYTHEEVWDRIMKRVKQRQEERDALNK